MVAKICALDPAKRESVCEYSILKSPCGEYSKRKEGKQNPHRKRKKNTKRKRVCEQQESTVYIELPKLLSTIETEKRG